MVGDGPFSKINLSPQLIFLKWLKNYDRHKLYSYYQRAVDYLMQSYQIYSCLRDPVPKDAFKTQSNT